MNDEVERLNRVLDDLAAERTPADHRSLSPDEAALVEAAVFLKAAAPAHAEPNEQFLADLETRLVSLQDRTARATPAAEEVSTALAPHAAPVPPARHVSRRGLIGRSAAALAGIAAGAGVGEVLRGNADDAAAAAAFARGRDQGYRAAVAGPYSVPLAPPDRGSWMETQHTTGSLKAGQAARFRMGAIEGFLVNPGNDKPIYAVSGACTHMGCLVSWLDSAGTFLCPCHGAQYQADGRC